MTKETMKYEAWGKKYELSFRKGQYRNNKCLAIQIMCTEEGEEYSEPFCMLTVNLASGAEEGCAYIDINNCPKDLIQMLIDEEIMWYTDIDRMSGYCIYPMFRFSDEWLKSIPNM